jgi:hypothetical protein
MFKCKVATSLVFLSVCLLCPLMAGGAGSVGTVVTLTGTVDAFAEWDAGAHAIVAGDWSGHITAVNQSRTVSKTYQLYTNVTVSIAPTGTTNSGILTNGVRTLTTEYMLTGNLDAPDADYKVAGAGAGEFFNAGNTYAITHVGGTGAYNVILSARMSSPAAAAPDSGNYTCGVTLTATW